MKNYYFLKKYFQGDAVFYEGDIKFTVCPVAYGTQWCEYKISKYITSLGFRIKTI